MTSAARSEAADRYASALFDLAKQDGALDAVQGDLRGLGALMTEHEALRRAIGNPAVSAEEKAAVFDAVAVAVNASPLVRNLLGVMARNRRAKALPGVIAAFDAMVAKENGVVSAHVASAVPLEDGEIAALAEALKSTVGQSVELTSEVKPELLGGLVVQVGSRLYDSSLRTQIDRVKSAMKGA